MRNKTFLLVVVLFFFLVISACSGDQIDIPPLVGTEAPEFTLDNALGGQTSLSDYQSTPVLLFFHMAVG
jgi:hypothetical protein